MAAEKSIVLAFPDDQDYWRQIEEYIHTATGADFSHGVCPECEKKWKANLGVDW